MRFTFVLMFLALAGIGGCSGDGQKAADTAGAHGRTGNTETEVAAAPAESADSVNVDACRAASAKLGRALKAALQEAMEKDGPLGAVNVCYEEAEVIANRICDEEGLIVGRTSRRFRNPSNEPDPWEKAGLDSFDARIAGGEKPEDLEMWATVTGPDGVRTFRYLRAIPTAPLCLGCHGGEIPADLDAKLKELYPEDKARGFAAGDMRGAFTVKMVLPGEAAPEG